MSWERVILEISLILGAAVKFLFGAPAIVATHGLLAGFLVSCFAGILGVSVFYFLSDYFMDRAEARRLRKIENGTAKIKKKFTRVNKFLVRIKMRLGMVGIAFISPTLISIPIGSIVMAKFYGDSRWAYPALVLSVVFWAAFFSSFKFFFPEFFDQLFS